jgi:hypothetical protein
MKTFGNRVRKALRSQPRRSRSGLNTCRPALEQLETRLVPSLVPASSPIDVTTGVGGQTVSTHRTAAETTSGIYRVVWEDQALGIYTRLFRPLGVPLANQVQVPNTGIDDSEATVAMDISRESVIAWTHKTGQTTSVLLQRFNAAGDPVGGPITVTSAYPGGSAHQPSVAMDDKAGAIVLAYTDSAPGSVNNAFASNQVKGMLFPANGPAAPLTVTPSKATSQPSVAMNIEGALVIAFTEDASPSDQDVYAQQFARDGTPQGSAVVVADSSHVENEPSAAIDTQGDFVVAYTYVRSSQVINYGGVIGTVTENYSEVHAVLFNAQGAVQTTDTVWASAKITENGYDPSAAMSAAGKFVVGYTRGGNYGAYDPNDGGPSVWASAYDETGALVQADINLAANLPETQHLDAGGTAFTFDAKPSVALSPAGHLVADWQNYGITYNGDLAGSGVFTQAFVNAPFQYQLLDGVTINIQGGMPNTYQIAITRDPGFNGPIDISLATLPTGVTYSVSPDDPNASSEVLTVTFNSADAVPSATLSSVLNISGGGVTLKPTVYFNVYPSLISGWTTSDPDGKTLVLGFQTTISGRGFVPGSTVQFGSANATATPSQIDPGGQWLTVTVPMNAVSGPITIIRPGGLPIVSSASAQYTKGGVTSLNTTAGYAPGYSAAFLQTGSQVIISGFGFQQGAKVVFVEAGNNDPTTLANLATQDGVGATPTSIDLTGTLLTVNVPRYAVSGQVVVVEPDGTALIYATQPFTVNNYRNTFAFSFGNFSNWGITWDLMKAEYGSQCDITILGNDTGIPDPFALVVWGIAAASLNNKGACYGMALMSVLMNEYDPSWINATNGLPPNTTATVYNLQQNDALTALIKQNHLAQISLEMIGSFLSWQTANALHQIHAATVRNEIESELQAGHHPIISMQAGADHAVVAYNIEDDPSLPGAYYIDVYDPNRPETGETTVAAHLKIEGTDSRIHVGPGDSWSFTMKDGSYHQGDFGSLEVFSASTVAGGVTLPANILAIVSGGLLTVIFGSAGPSAPVSTAQTAPLTLAPPLAPGASDAVLFVPPHGDLTRQLAQARMATLAEAGPGGHTGWTGLEFADLDWQDAWLDRVAVNPQPLPPGQ